MDFYRTNDSMVKITGRSMVRALLAGGLFAVCSVMAGTLAKNGLSVSVGMADTAAYFPLLKGRRIALLTNHTAVADLPGASGADASGRVHLVDLLYRRGFEVTGIFSPEHGFRGGADAGESVSDSVDPSTGIPIRSLYDGSARRPSDAAMRSFDVLVVDMQDVGLRFYTYHISMLRLMEACAAYDKPVIVLDRPNPNGSHVDGPVLEKKYRSGVGLLPVPVLHGLTMGEIARMAVGEGWIPPCALTVIPCRHYTHSTEYLLPVAPSPNLPTQRARHGQAVRMLRPSGFARVRLYFHAPSDCRGPASSVGGRRVSGDEFERPAVVRGSGDGLLSAVCGGCPARFGIGRPVLHADVREIGRDGLCAGHVARRGFGRGDSGALAARRRPLSPVAGPLPALSRLIPAAAGR